MTNGEMHSVFAVCHICGAETEMKIDDDEYDSLNKLEDDWDIVDFNDYLEAFNDPKLAEFLYAGFCPEHSKLV